MNRGYPQAYPQAYNKAIVPFHIDEADLIDSFNFRLSNVQRIEAFNRVSDAYQQLLYRLKALGCIQTPLVCDSNTDCCPAISFNQRPGTEDFLAAKEAKPDTYYAKGPIRVNCEKSFWILAEIYNDCPDEKSFAVNVRLKMSIHRINDKKNCC